MRILVYFLLFICCFWLSNAISCGPGYKPSSNDSICVDLTNKDVLGAIHWLSDPPQAKKPCNKLTTVQGISICEDHLAKTSAAGSEFSNSEQMCNVVSFIATTWCDHYGSLEFEKYWANRGCNVTIYHFHVFFKGNYKCFNDESLNSVNNINVVRGDMWGGKCYNCFYRSLKLPSNGRIDILKIQERQGVSEDFEGAQFTVMSDLYRYSLNLVPHIRQIVFRASINSNTLVDTVGREGEHAWNMWGSQQFLLHYGAVSSHKDRGRYQPLQFSHLLSKADVSTEFGSYLHTFSLEMEVPYSTLGSSAKLDLDTIANHRNSVDAWKPVEVPVLKATVPLYCKKPTEIEDAIMQEWIKTEMNVRCHLTRLAVPCDRNRPYDAIIPCEQELMDKLADDYASSKGWCDFNNPNAEIVELTKVDPRASKAFQRQDRPLSGVRLAFFFTVYHDMKYFQRLLSRLYSKDHYYLVHVDAAGSSEEFTVAMKAYAESFTEAKNVYVAKDIPIVYGASTATILLTKAMAWFLRHASNWDYFVPVTGSDYPLLPLHRMEKIFAYQQPPMPFVMAWTAGTSTHIFRLQKTHPIFEEDPLLLGSIKATSDERGKILGQVPMEYRSMNFGPPLFCNGQKSFYHLDNRANKSARIYDTQWLFPRDRFPGRGRAYAEEDPKHPIYPYDGVFRVWKKSDPATTGAYDYKSIEYIINSEEGKKYYHFFQHMLLGSEEHYYASLLYNWPRTKGFIQTISAQIVWNTWELGLWENSGGGFQTHTHFLTMNEWKIIEGFSKRGMMFARKFSMTKTAALLDAIDNFIHNNESTIAGLYWPGFFPTDITTPGKQWVPALHKNATLRRMGLLPPYEFPESCRDIEARYPSTRIDLSVKKPAPPGKRNANKESRGKPKRGRGTE